MKRLLLVFILVSKCALQAVATTPIVINNWAGLLASSNPTSVNPGRVTKVSGTFVVPTLNLNSTNYSQVSIWLGMDGHLPFGSNTVEQIGITSQLINGQQQNSAWLEMYPYQPITLDINVNAGDTIETSVEYGQINIRGYYPFTGYTLTIKNLSSGENKTRHFAKNWARSINLTPKRNSAEWVVEGYPGQFANFGTVKFSDIQVTFDNGNNITYNTANMSPSMNASGPFLATAGQFANNSISIFKKLV